MIANGVRYSYGPVPSRRLGKSLGINNIPAKVCTYSCVYCQVGRTTRMLNDRISFFEPEDIAVLARAGSPWETVERIVGQCDLVKTEYGGRIFYMRRLAKNREAAA